MCVGGASFTNTNSVSNTITVGVGADLSLWVNCSLDLISKPHTHKRVATTRRLQHLALASLLRSRLVGQQAQQPPLIQCNCFVRILTSMQAVCIMKLCHTILRPSATRTPHLADVGNISRCPSNTGRGINDTITWGLQYYQYSYSVTGTKTYGGYDPLMRDCNADEIAHKNGGTFPWSAIFLTKQTRALDDAQNEIEFQCCTDTESDPWPGSPVCPAAS